MPNTSPGITIPGIPSGGTFGYPGSQDALAYDPATHIGGTPPAAGIVAQALAFQNQLGNILTAAQSGFEDGTVAGWSGQNGTVANSVGPAHSGTHSLQFTGTGTPSNGNIVIQALTIPASYIGYNLSCSAWVFPTMVARQTRMMTAYFTSGSALIGSVIQGPLINETLNVWNLVPPQVTTVPATAFYINVYVSTPGGQATGEIRYMDDAALAPA